MTVEEAIYLYLTANNISRIYPVVFPDDVVFPAVRYQMLDALPEYSHQGKSGLTQTRIQFSCFGRTYSAANNMAEKIKELLSGYKGDPGIKIYSAFVILGPDFYESETKLFHVPVTARIMHDD